MRHLEIPYKILLHHVYLLAMEFIMKHNLCKALEIGAKGLVAVNQPLL